ncbi:MAG TPA: hypothetical protein VF556_03195 [Pyrinomonadaceae bacterium]|jgi:transposase-like protein
MGKTLHKNARTSEEIRRAIQNSNESLVCLAKRYDINPKTVAKWRKRTTVEDSPMGPRHPHSTVLTTEEEAVITAFRKHTALPLDDCLRALKTSIPRLTRSALHRCFKRHKINRLSDITGNISVPEKSALNPAQNQTGYFQLDIVEVRCEQKQICLFVGIDHSSKFVYAEFHPNQTKERIGQFVRRLAAFVPYQIHAFVDDDGTDWLNQSKGKRAIKSLFNRIKIKGL